jgi:hypothetical protein
VRRRKSAVAHTIEQFCDNHDLAHFELSLEVIQEGVITFPTLSVQTLHRHSTTSLSRACIGGVTTYKMQLIYGNDELSVGGVINKMRQNASSASTSAVEHNI